MLDFAAMKSLSPENVLLRLLPVILLLGFAIVGRAESGYDAWLRYSPLEDAGARRYREALPSSVTSFVGSGPVQSASQELIRGVRGMLGRKLRSESKVLSE